MEQKNWAGSTYGNGWMHKMLIRSLSAIDVRVLYLFSNIFVVPVCLVLNRSRKTAWNYFRNIHGFGRLKSAWMTYLNHCKFSEVVIDRFAMYAGRQFDVQVEGMEHFKALESRDEAFLHLSSHIGNYEIAGYTLVSVKKMIHAVVYG